MIESVTDALLNYGVLGLWLSVTLLKEWKQTDKLTKALDRVGDTLKVHDQVVRAKLNNSK